MTYVRCYSAKPEDKCFTQGKMYTIHVDPTEGSGYFLVDDECDEHEINLSSASDNEWEAVGSSARFVCESEDSISTPEEDEEWQRLHQKQQEGILCKDHVHIGWTQEETTAPEQSIDCPVAIAYHIHELQKWLKHIGCSSEAEFRISSDYVWASPDEFVTYEAKEGGVGTLIEYMRHIGGASECIRKMENVG